MENNIVNFYRMDSQQMNDAIDRIVVEVHNKKRSLNKKVILMSGCGSMAGVTSLSINLAIALSMAGWKTLLIDSDLRKSKKYKRIGKEARIGLSEYLSKTAKKEEIIQKTNYPGFNYISCGSAEISPVRLLCSSEMNTLMSEVQDEYEYVIIDSPSLNIVSDSSILLPVVDGIILVGSLNKMTKHQLEDARRIVSKYKEKYYGLIINQVDDREYRKYIRDYDYFRDKKMEKKHKNDMKKIKKRKSTRLGDNKNEK